MMKLQTFRNAMRILVISHSDRTAENAVTWDLAKRGHQLYLRRSHLDAELPRRSIDAAISLGGAEFVTEIDQHEWMQKERDWIRWWVGQDRPFLGICLGAQILASAFGGRVWRYPNERSEVGFYRVEPTFEGQQLGFLSQKQHFYQWHLEGFEPPEGAQTLARSERFSNQAFRLKQAVYGVQFHPEILGETIELWTRVVRETKPYIYERPGVQQPETHLPQWEIHKAAIEKWRGDFLAQWLSEWAD